MRPVTVVADGTTPNSAVVPIDQYIAPTNIAMGVVVSGTVTFQVQHTYDDPFAEDFDPATAVWFNHPTLTGSANADSNYAFPPRAVRITRTAGTGSATMTLVQSGPN